MEGHPTSRRPRSSNRTSWIWHVAVVLATATLLGMPAPGSGAEPSASPPSSFGAPTPTPSPVAVDQPPGTLQSLVDAAAPGAIVQVPPGRYREMVTIRKPITLDGPGAEILGSDVWRDWSGDGETWLSGSTVPELYSGGECAEPRCAWPEQVFVDDQPLLQVSSDPGPGQFALTPDRRVILGDDPTGETVEVSVRQTWIDIQAPDVTIDGFEMREVASPAQSGGIHAGAGADGVTIRNVDLKDAHGALVNFRDLTGGSLLDSRLERAGQVGVEADSVHDLSLVGNQILDNNSEGFDTGWEAGGVKITRGSDLEIRNNVVTGNIGPGIWCDIDCTNVTITANRVGENSRSGIMFEISDGATIENNVVWDNGWGFATWAWGGGILVSSARNALIEGNLVAWNADGLSVVSQDRGRPGGDLVRNVQVVDNTIVAGPKGGWLISLVEDWAGGIDDASSGNVAKGNRFFEDRTAPSECQYMWGSCQVGFEGFVGSPGVTASTALTDEEAHAALTQAGLTTPIPHVVNDPPRRRDLAAVALAVAIGIMLLVAIAGLTLVFRRRRSRHDIADPS